MLISLAFFLFSFPFNSVFLVFPPLLLHPSMRLSFAMYPDRSCSCSLVRSLYFLLLFITVHLSLECQSTLVSVYFSLPLSPSLLMFLSLPFSFVVSFVFAVSIFAFRVPLSLSVSCVFPSLLVFVFSFLFLCIQIVRFRVILFGFFIFCCCFWSL